MVTVINILINQINELGYGPSEVLINPKDRFKFIPYKIGKYRSLNFRKILNKIR